MTHPETAAPIWQYDAVKFALRLPQPMAGLGDLAAASMELSSIFAAQASDASAERSAPIQCRKGCGACCRQLAPVSPPEAFLIERMIAGMPESRRSEVERRFTAAEERLRGAGLFDRLMSLDDPALTDEDHYGLAREYFALQLACPFLEDESCSVHQNRPSVCREYLVFSPPELCASPFTRPIRRVPVPIRLREALAGVAAQMLGGEVQLVPLALALAWAGARREVGLRRWDSGELAARFMLHLDLHTGPGALE